MNYLHQKGEQKYDGRREKTALLPSSQKKKEDESRKLPHCAPLRSVNTKASSTFIPFGRQL